ncbi:MAG: hypothetical protein Q9157_005263 [Trypethelium eluteriae]
MPLKGVWKPSRMLQVNGSSLSDGQAASLPLSWGTFGHASEPLHTFWSIRNGVWCADCHWLGRSTAALGTGAVGPRHPCGLPHLVVSPATVTGALARSGWMEARMLVERDGVNRVIAAEDVPASTAVVTPIEEGECLVAVA